MSYEGLKFGHYQLLKLIGSGEMSDVYLAEAQSLHRQVAIKVIRAEANQVPSVYERQEAIRLFKREMQLISQISPAIDDVILQALAKNSNERFPSILAFANAFQQALIDPLPLIKNTSRSATALLYGILTVLLSLCVGATLYAFGKLPSYIVTMVSVIWGVLGALVGAIVVNLLSKEIIGSTLRQAKALQAITGSIVTVALLGLLVSFLPSSLAINSPVTNPAVPQPSASLTVFPSAPINNNPYLSYEKNLVLNDPLTNNGAANNWLIYNDTYGSCMFSGNAYHIRYSRPDYYLFCTAQTSDFSNFVYQVQMTIIQGDVGGIVFHVDSANKQFYYFHINTNGLYGLDLYVDTTRRNAISLANGYSSNIQSQTNVIAVVANNNMFDLYVNYILVGTAVGPNSAYGYGQVGLMADSHDATTEVAFTNAKVWTF